MRDRRLDYPPANAYRTYQAPATMDLAVLLARRIAQLHGRASERIPTRLPRGKVGTTHCFAHHAQRNSMIPLTRSPAKTAKQGSNCSSWASLGARAGEK